MTLEQIVQRIVTDLTSQGVDDSEIFASEIVDLVNQMSEQVRLNDIKAGKNLSNYSVQNEFTFTQKSQLYPGLYETSINPPVLKAVSTNDAIIASVAFLTTNTIKNSSSSAKEGDIALKGESVYKCVQTFSGVNTYNSTFEAGAVTKHYMPGKTLQLGDYVINPKTNKVYQATATITPTEPDPDDNIDLDLLYWQKLGPGFVNGSLVDFQSISTMPFATGAFSVYGGKLYSNKVGRISLAYIPEYTLLSNPNDVLTLPNESILQVREAVVQKLARKIQTPVRDQNE